jgi:hypothetical protein
MKYIKLFEEYSDRSKKIMTDIMQSVSGMGTDEEKLAKAIDLIKTPKMLLKIDAALKKGSFPYKSIKDAVINELGESDIVYIKKIKDKFTSLGLPKYLLDGVIKIESSVQSTPSKKVEVTGEYSPKPGDWDGMHSFQSRRSDGFGGKMNDIVNDALIKYYDDEQKNPSISKIEITMDESAWKVKWKCIIEESKDGKAWIGLTSRGGAGHPTGAFGSINRAQRQIDDKIKKLSSEFNEPDLETKQILDYNYDSKNSNIHIRQIFVMYTNPTKYPPY